MAIFRAISVAALGIASYALYKTGALDPAIKKAAKVSVKATDFADSTIAKAKDKYKNLKKEMKKEADSTVVEGEIIS